MSADLAPDVRGPQVTFFKQRQLVGDGHRARFVVFVGVTPGWTMISVLS